jgi:TRAP-type C4-dicarboxylate transport system substrate-binding protein
VVSGMSDLAVVATGMTPGRFPMSEIDTLPMLFPSGEITGNVYHELMQKYAFDNEFKEVKFLYALALPPAQLFLRKPVKTLEDLKGLTLRIEGKVEAKTFEALGARGVMVSLMELYGSLDRGLADGAAFVPNGVLIFGIHKITKYRVKADLFCRAFPMLMNKGKFNSLPPEIQKIFEDHSGIAYSIRWGKLTDGVQIKALKDIAAYDQQVGNPGFYELPKEERARWKKQVMPIWDTWVKEKEAKGLPAKAMLNEAVQLIDEYPER